MMRGGAELPNADAKDEVVMSSRGGKKNDPAVAWLAPLRKKLEEARASGVGLSELREQIRAWKTDRRALADAMARNIMAGFERGAAAAQGAVKGTTTEEEVSAVRGCNQHEHKPECEDANENEGQESEEEKEKKEKIMVTPELELFDGYHINEFGHGEINDLEQLRTFLLGPAVVKTEGNSVALGEKTISVIASEIGNWYKKQGVSQIVLPHVGIVELGTRGVKDSAGHFLQNKKTTSEHKQRVADAFYLVPDVLKKGVLMEYGAQTDNIKLTSFVYGAPVEIGEEKCIMVVRVKKQEPNNGRFYLHSVDLIDNIKKKASASRIRETGQTSTSLGAESEALKGPLKSDPRDVFRIPKKALEVKASRQEKEDTFSLTRLVDMILT